MAWPYHDVPDSKRDILALISRAEESQRRLGSSPILVICRFLVFVVVVVAVIDYVLNAVENFDEMKYEANHVLLGLKNQSASF